MPVTIIGDASPDFPQEFIAPIIEIKWAWSSGWEYDPELEMVHCAAHASSSAVSTLQFRRIYGDRKLPHESDFPNTAANPRDFTGAIVRMRIMGPQGPETQFVGVVAGRQAEMQGTDAIPAGQEVFVAYGGLYLLQKLEVYQAEVLNSDSSPSTETIGWLPPMNSRDKRNMLVGNARDGGGGLFYYGGSEIWTHSQYLLYLIENFIKQDDGPEWTVGGQLELIDAMSSTIDFGHKARASDMLRELIPVRFGVDYYVKPTDDGFEINVFALTDKVGSVAGVSMPQNPNTVEVHKLKHTDLFETKIVQTDDKRYDQIRVQGKRIVVCLTLRGARGADGEDTGNPSLVKKWSADLEALYISADGKVTAEPDVDPSKWDEVRAGPKFTEVYQHLGAPADWDRDDGWCSVYVTADGRIARNGSWQDSMRDTLPWIPLRVGYDYSHNPPVAPTGVDVTADHQAPLVWLLDELHSSDGVQSDATEPRYVLASTAGIHVSKPYQDIGVILNASPNHRLALNHMTEAQFGKTGFYSTPSYGMKAFDYETAIATIAIESDHRVHVTSKIPDGIAAGDGSVMVIQDEGAELWVLAPGTVVGLDVDGKPKTSDPELITLRDDRDRLAMLAAGAMTRYVNERVRAQLDWRGHTAWGNLVGQIMTMIVQGEQRQAVGAPITSVEWTMKPTPMTIIRTGYA